MLTTNWIGFCVNGDHKTYLFDSFGVERTRKKINRQKNYHKKIYIYIYLIY